MESNPVAFSFKTLEEAQGEGTDLARRAGCLTGSYQCLVYVLFLLVNTFWIGLKIQEVYAFNILHLKTKNFLFVKSENL